MDSSESNQNGTEEIGSQSGIDEGLYSRQLYVLGMDAMKKMSSADVLVIGVGGLGVEIAKNVILGGVKSMTIFDPEPVSTSDFSSQFFLSEEDIGKPRGAVAAPKLQELNAYVPVSVHTGSLDEAFLSRFRVVVSTTLDVAEQCRVNSITHAWGISFISARTAGLFGYCFVDNGEKFTVTDTNGEAEGQALVACITQDTEGLVTCVDESRHSFADGDYVVFSEVRGMTGINTCGPQKIRVVGPYTFTVGDTTAFSPYEAGGVVRQVKMPVTMSFKSLEESLDDPEYLIVDWTKSERPVQLHLGFQALDAFRTAYGRLPAPRNEADARTFLKLAEMQRGGNGVVLDKGFLQQLASQATGDIAPVNAVIGGTAAQEVMKACSGKFSPIRQWMYFDSLESLPPGISELPDTDFAPCGSRYDHQVTVFGKSLVEKLQNAKLFLVGAGAIGCEMLKNWTMMGGGCGPEGTVIVTDMDTIEKSNLNRQFLFRPWDVSKHKSERAAAAVKAMNRDVKIEAHQNQVGPESEEVYGDDFFEAVDVVVNALDNVDARRYMDRRCVYYRKPLLESGTLGTKGNTQVVIPYLTESYSSSQDPPEKSIPVCTLKNFPYAIEHTIQWARDTFEGLFTQTPQLANQYLSDPGFIAKARKQGGAQAVEMLESVQKALSSRPDSYNDCIVWARLKFQEFFADPIKQLLFNFPPDQVTTSGTPFWSPPKRCPKPIAFDANETLHIDFVEAMANLYAFVYCLPSVKDRAQVERVVAKVQVPEFTPKSGVKISVSDAEAAAADESIVVEDDVLDKLIGGLPPVDSCKPLCVVEFEKDDDSNFHIDAIMAISNLRAACYGIAPANRLQTKGIAGRIIPAIATTTALVAGLVCLELYKVLGGHKAIDRYKNGFANLALPLFAFSEPVPYVRNKYNGVEWGLWDRFDLEGPLTLREFLDIMKKQHKLEVTMLSSGVSMIYSFFMPPARLKKRLEMLLEDCVQAVTCVELPTSQRAIVFEICADDVNGEDAEVPYVRYVYRK